MSKQHARFSPSRLEGLEECPKYERIDTPDVADEGNLLHDASEKEDRTGLTSEQRVLVDSALAYKDYVKSRAPGAVEEKEVKLELKGLTYGFADVILVFPDGEADVIDYKFGRIEVTEAAKNLQLQTYAAALLEMRPEIQKVRVHAVQPRVGNPNSAEFDRTLLARTRARIELVYEKAADPFAPPTRCDNCDYCRHIDRCPAWKPTLVRIADVMQLPAPEVLRGEIEPSVDDRAVMQSLATSLEKVADQWKASNRKFVIDDGNEIPGYRIQERGTGPKVQDVATALRLLADGGYASHEQLIACLKLSIPDLAESMTTIRGGDAKGERARILEILGDLVTEAKTRFLAKAKKSK
jgi:hypothetical protein